MTKFLLISLLFINQTFATGFIPNSFSASFEQVYKSALTGKEKRSKGTMDYMYPGNIKLETSSPESLTYVSNDSKTWYYTPAFIESEPGQVTIQDATKNELTKFLDILRKGLLTNKLYKVSKNKAGEYFLEFSKTIIKDLGVEKAKLTFKKDTATFKNLKIVEMTLSNKKTKKLELSKIVEGPKFKKEHFVFKVPANTKINR
ncbi:LolA family protein [Halobacteriovorax marinus]|nr:outer membrane lipoprotein carrier protein LolA [Halobacteriovorax marinus]